MPKVLIADDDARLRRLIRVTLGQDYDAFEAANGLEALALVERERPDVVLLDQRMPGLSGHDVCRRIKDNPATSTIAVVMVSVYATETDRVDGLAAGADAYVSKPFSPVALLGIVERLLAASGQTSTSS